MLTTIIMLLMGFVFLLVGGELLVRSATAIALRLSITPFVTGLTVVGFGTSMPEMVVSVQATLEGAPAIATGNVVGSNIANILLILGAAALISPFIAKWEELSLDLLVVSLATGLLVTLLVLHELDRATGVILLLLLFSYLGLQFSKSSQMDTDTGNDPGTRTPHIAVTLCMFAAGLAGLVIGADWLVDSSVIIARSIGVSEAVIGLSMIAIGTSLPELATSVIAALKKQGNIALGNVIGSNIFNVLGILGVAATLSPVPLGNAMTSLNVWVLCGSMVALVAIVIVFGRIGRFIGATMIAAYLAYIVTLYCAG